ncbi:hypothetical protein CRG98_026519 [Punica granatum]|uniref:G-patch domain-containing protein n=1 Tax=Punica granatum TaxID=22663 RepID=A0A2I0JB09_PUNGR|nr:hypothetical protein CRG98_026519 [Punica granatum]
MAQGQKFEEYDAKWRAQAAKHILLISEAQQIQLFHSTLRGVYYSHLLAHTSSFSDLIEAGKKLDLGIKLGRMEDPTSKGEESSKKVPATSSSSSGRRGKEILVNTVNTAVPWTYEGSVGNLEQQFSVMGITRSGRLYENSATTDKGKAPVTEEETRPRTLPTPSKKVTEEEAEAFMKVIKASKYKVVEQMAKSPAHISLLALLLNSEPHREALIRVLTAAQVPKGTPPNRIEETINSIFSNTISFSDDELPSEGCAHFRALHIVCKCNNHIVGRVMIDNGSALDVCPVTTLKQMNVDLNRIRPSKTAIRAFNGSRREVNGEIDLLIDIGPCSFSITFQVLDIPNAFSLLLGRPWIHSASAIPSSLHQKETAVPYINVGDDENLPFHSFETVSVIRDYGKVGPSRTDRMIGKILLRHHYIPGTGLGARGQGINRPIEVEAYKHRRGLGFRPSCHEIIEARRGNHLHRLATHYGRLHRGIPVPPLSHFFPGPPLIVGSTSDGPSSDFDDATDALPTVMHAGVGGGVHARGARDLLSE